MALGTWNLNSLDLQVAAANCQSNRGVAARPHPCMMMLVLVCLLVCVCNTNILAQDGMPGLGSPRRQPTVRLVDTRPSQFELHTITPTPIRSSVTRSLDGREVACLAARQSGPARALQARGQTILRVYCNRRDDELRAARNISRFLQGQAQWQRDMTAAQALKAYYSRIAIAEQLDVSEEAAALIERSRRQLAAVVSSGLRVTTDLTEFERQRIENEEQQARLDIDQRRLRGVLESLTGIDYRVQETGLEPLDILVTELDEQRLIALAHRQRPDLQAWRTLNANIRQGSAEVYAQILGGITNGFGIPLPTLGGLAKLFHHAEFDGLSVSLQREISIWVDHQTELIAREVADRTLAVELSYRRIEAVQQQLESWKARFRQLRQLEQQGEGRAAERLQVESEILKTQSDHIQRRLEARLAEVDLANAIGGLSERCCRGEAWLVTDP